MQCLTSLSLLFQVISHFEQEGILSQASTDAVKEYFRFKNALCQSVFEILRTVITLLKMRRDAPFSYEGWDNSYLKPIQIALDFTRLDSAVSYRLTTSTALTVSVAHKLILNRP